MDPILDKYLPNTPIKPEETVKLLPPSVQQPLVRFNLRGLGGIFESKNLNLYIYSHQNPIRYSDPDGKEAGEGPINANLVLFRNIVDTANPTKGGGRIKIAAVAKLMGNKRFNSDLIVRSESHASQTQIELSETLRDDASSAILPEILKTVKSEMLSSYVAAPALKFAGAAGSASKTLLGDNIEMGAEISGLGITTDTAMSLGQLAKTVNGTSNNEALYLYNSAIVEVVKSCFSSGNCGDK